MKLSGVMEAIAVIDMNLCSLYIYDVPEEWGTEEIESHIVSEGHQLSTSSWGTFDGVVNDLR